jgi:hypothetical protein
MNYIKTRLNNWVDSKINKIAYLNKVQYINDCVLHCNEMGITNEQHTENEIIVSLTTYRRRLYDVYLAIESMMQQTIKPNRIILWLGDELKDTDIPLTLKRQQKRGLEIRYCKDIGSYTKLIPVLMAFPSAAIITVDDDLLYSFDLIENLVSAYKKNPSLIHCLRMHRMKLRKNNTLEKYLKWILDCEYFDVSPLNFPTGVGGVLYPPNCFNKEVFNENVFLDICKYADDVWFKAMALLNNVFSQKVYSHNKNGNDFLTNTDVQDTALYQINKTMNDVQLKTVFDKYNLYEKLFKNNGMVLK